MEEIRLPHNGKEGFLYGSIICILTVIVMLFLNIGTSFGKIDKEVVLIIIKAIPIVWIMAMLIETLIVGKIAHFFVEKFSDVSDGFNSKILFNIVFCVVGMSVIMTIVGGWIGTGFGIEPILEFPKVWPRNFCVAFWCEILLAQPVARYVMKKIHLKNHMDCLKES